MALFSILPNTFKISGKVKYENLKKRLLSSITLAAFVSFLINQYVYSLITELIIVPIFVIFAALIGISQSLKEKSSANFFQYIILVFTIFALIHSFILIIKTRDFINLSFWISFLTDALGWLINIPLLFLFSYVGQLDLILNFFVEKKTFLSFFRYLLVNMRIRKQLDVKQLNTTLITKVELGGLLRKCYQITFKDRATKIDADRFILAFRTMKGPKSMYKGMDQFFPLRINCINGSHHRIDFWEDERLEKIYQTGEFYD
ncbi:hypothetical protein [Oenococcus sp.]|uniref:hypothetical protein n=1 Tax=Oenococcus sp. TaxID=1979414 RepID=UPI0039E9E5F6